MMLKTEILVWFVVTKGRIFTGFRNGVPPEDYVGSAVQRQN